LFLFYVADVGRGLVFCGFDVYDLSLITRLVPSFPGLAFVVPVLAALWSAEPVIGAAVAWGWLGQWLAAGDAAAFLLVALALFGRLALAAPAGGRLAAVAVVAGGAVDSR